MRFCAIFLLALALNAPAAAQQPSVTELFDQFGLFGVWAINCDREPALDNPRVTVLRPSSAGPVIENDDAGPGTYVNHYTIVSAKRLDDDTLSVRVLYRPGTRQQQLQDQVWRVRDNSRRTLFNKPKGERARVKDGIIVGSGTETPVLHRCNDTPVKHRAALLGQTRRFPG